MYSYSTINLKIREFIEFESSEFREFGRVARIGVPEGEKKKTCANAEMKNEADAEIRYRNEDAAPLGATCF